MSRKYNFNGVKDEEEKPTRLIGEKRLVWAGKEDKKKRELLNEGFSVVPGGMEKYRHLIGPLWLVTRF